MGNRWRLKKSVTFEAAHKLPHHDGKCQRLHGHSWKADLLVQGFELHKEGAKKGMVMDYGDIKSAITPILENQLDHHYLNETTGLENPTSEELARWIFERLKPIFPQLIGVEVHETCTSCCLYTE